MTPDSLLTAFMCYLPVLPAALLCYAPFKNKLRFSKRIICEMMFLLFLILSPTVAFCKTHLFLGLNTPELPILIICYILFHITLDTHISKSLGIYVEVMALMAFMTNMSIFFDAYLYPASDLAHFSLEAALFRTVVCTLLTGLLYYPFAHFGSYLIDNLNQSLIWNAFIVISGIFLFYNLSNAIQIYSTLHTNNVARAYLTNQIMFFALLLLLNVIFYFLVNSLLEKSRTDERNRILEMQEKHYLSQQKYLEETSRTRHDFRHALHTLQEMAEKGEHESVLNFLNCYIEKLPEKNTKDYSNNAAVNAVLNHYLRIADESGITVDQRIFLPENLYIESIDLCSVLGNLLENAITANLDLPRKERYISLVISPEQGSELYIAISNRFNGKVDYKGSRYLSTHKGGHGIGLISVTATAERYNGSADFYHRGHLFHSNVMMVNRKQPAS